MPNQIKTCPHRGNMKRILIVLVCWLTTLARCSLEPAGYKPPGTGYLPGSSVRSIDDDFFTGQLSGDLSLPSQNEPVPFSQYLPANRQTSDQSRDYESSFNEQWRNRQTPREDYLPASGFSHQSSPRVKNYPRVAGQPRNPWSSSSENYAPAKYEFQYDVKDDNGNDYGHKEMRNGEHTQGVYRVLLPDGRTQVVHYEADSHGYRPIISYEDTRQSGGRYGSNHQGYQY